jgi:ABC-type branched-subunit amino acid transport system substrate-binding protein
LTGAPIRIGIVAPEQSQAISVPDVHRAAEMGVMVVNAHGGVHGHPLALDYCDDQDNAQTAAQCAQTLLVTDKDVMLVGAAPGEEGGTPFYPVLKETHKISFGNYPTGLDDGTNPLSYPFVPSTFQLATFSSVLPKGSGTVAVITYTGAQGFIGSLVQPGVSAKGYKMSIVTEAATTVDWSVAANAIIQDHAKYVLLSVAENSVTTIVNSLQQAGSTATVILMSTSANSQALTQLADSSVPSLVPAATTTNPSDSTMYKSYQAALAKYGKALGFQDTVGQQIVNAYAAVLLFAQVANKVSTVNSPTIQKYMDEQTDFSTGGLTHPLNFTEPGALKGYPRIFNTWELPAKAVKGNYQITSSDWLGAS